MITREEIARSVYGAWRLARLDPGGMRCFDGTEESFWRSFFAAAIVAPAYALLTGMTYSQLPPGSSVFRITIVECIAYVIGWTAFPLAAVYLTRMVDRGGRYFAYITAYNWSQVISTVLLLAVSFLGQTVVPGPLAPLLGLAAIAVILAYEWYIARTALNCAGLFAAGFVAVSTFITLVVKNAAIAILQVGPAG